MMSDEYTLTVDVATVDSLGRNLYSNAAAVLSEFVANAWDADANTVSIDYNPDDGTGSISITDDGCGMDVDTLNSRFLTVGYRKRNEEGDESPLLHRKYMGRKGIGKLSAFSLADSMRVESKRRIWRPRDSRSTLSNWIEQLEVRIRMNISTIPFP